MQITVVQKPVSIAEDGWKFQLKKFLAEAAEENRQIFDEFERAEDGGEKVEVLYALRDQKIPSFAAKINRLIREIEDYGPGETGTY